MHYPQQGDHHTLSTHYQSAYDTSSSLHIPNFNLSPSTVLQLPQRPRQESHRSMPASQHLSNPTVRVHKSTPSLASEAQPTGNQLMLAQGAFLGSVWGSEGYTKAGYLDTTAQQTGRYHKRLSSASSINSTGPPSPHDHTAPFCHIANSESAQYSPLENLDCVSTPLQHTFPKALPTPVGTPTSNSLMPLSYQNAPAPQDSQGYSAAAMRRIRSSTGDDNGASFGIPGPQSTSSMSHNSPATPHTNYEIDYDDRNFGRGEKIHSEMDSRMDEYSLFDPGYPQSEAFSQAMQDVFPDQNYGTPTSQGFSRTSQPNLPHTSSHLSPYRSMNNVFANRLQAANQDHMAQRTSSPVTSIQRERSPFKSYNNTLQGLDDVPSPQNPMTALTQSMLAQPHTPTAPKSVSPKVLMLEDPEVDNAATTPLFQQQFGQTSSFVNHVQDANQPSYSDQNGIYSGQSYPATSVQVPQQYPFISNRRRQQSSQGDESNQVPEFPAHMISMETTMEEGSSEPSASQQSNIQPSTSQIARPGDTSSDAGTYTCTYHGCSLRFETPAKLQKHKRESHRQTSPASGPTSAPTGPSNLGLRNSQAGPHRCARINPSTGKPCHSIFSRPYDLTRHEDTIHNARKQKVRCHLCAEEKTFSRNDALTRHMRVVHPDVDWPGKTRRGKGGRE